AQLADNDLFLRRHLVQILARNITRDEHFPNLLARLGKDESGAVRQALADVLPILPKSLAVLHCQALRDDEDPQVRASIFADILKLLDVITPNRLAAHIAHILAEDDDEFVLRIAMDASTHLAAHCRHAGDDHDDVIKELQHTFQEFQSRDLSPKVLRWADEAYEQIWLTSDPQAIEIAQILREVTHDQLEADIRPIRALAQFLPDQSETVGRVMAVLAQRDFGLSLKKGRRPSIQRGEWFKRRLWRILFEGSSAATDKRQAHIHTTGRHYHGTVIAPSARMAELAPTKVPGEPLVEASEGGWRNYLPLLDQALSALDHGDAIEIYTSAGITELQPPEGFGARARAFLAITRRFADLAQLRNREPTEFLAALRALGISIKFRAYPDVTVPNRHISQMLAEGEAE
ncbi:MAG: hypothetical protein AAGK17_02920, partial [Pseudomonadota bacterium]